MRIFYSNINRINEDVEDFVIAKNKIEQSLIESDKLEKKMTIQEFIEYIDLTSDIFLLNNNKNDVIAFHIYKLDINEFVIIYSTDCEKEQIETFKKYLEKIKYNVNNLTQFQELDLLNGNINGIPYFLINGNFFK